MLYPQVFALLMDRSLSKWAPTLHGLLVFGVLSHEQMHRLFWSGQPVANVNEAMEYLSEAGVVERVESTGGELAELAEVGIPCLVVYGLTDLGRMLVSELCTVWLYEQN